jgi:hypothetical protein
MTDETFTPDAASECHTLAAYTRPPLKTKDDLLPFIVFNGGLF